MKEVIIDGVAYVPKEKEGITLDGDQLERNSFIAGLELNKIVLEIMMENPEASKEYAYKEAERRMKERKK